MAEANIFLRYIYMRDPVTDEYQAEGLTKVISVAAAALTLHSDQECCMLVATYIALAWRFPKG